MNKIDPGSKPKDSKAPRASDQVFHDFDELSPRVDRPSLIKTNRIIGSINHGVGRLRELRDDGIGHAGIAISVISSAPASGFSNCTCRPLTKGFESLAII